MTDHDADLDAYEATRVTNSGIAEAKKHLRETLSGPMGTAHRLQLTRLLHDHTRQELALAAVQDAVHVADTQAALTGLLSKGAHSLTRVERRELVMRALDIADELRSERELRAKERAEDERRRAQPRVDVPAPARGRASGPWEG